MRLQAASAVLALTAACAKGPPYVVAAVAAPPGLPSACVVVELIGDGHPAFDLVVPRDPGQDALRVAVFQKDWPQDVTLEAFVPTACGPEPFVRLARSP